VLCCAVLCCAALRCWLCLARLRCVLRPCCASVMRFAEPKGQDHTQQCWLSPLPSERLKATSEYALRATDGKGYYKGYCPLTSTAPQRRSRGVLPNRMPVSTVNYLLTTVLVLHASTMRRSSGLAASGE
jgi:hypothetical protein